MRCPFCSFAEDKVVDSRGGREDREIRRRRECLRCNRRFTTYERLEQRAVRVIKKDGTRVPFDAAKLRAGIARACEKRPVATADIERVVVRIEQTLQDQPEPEYASRFIGEAVMLALQELDPVAYVRFASVYREFKDVNAFMDEIKSLIRASGPADGGATDANGNSAAGAA